MKKNLLLCTVKSIITHLKLLPIDTDITPKP